MICTDCVILDVVIFIRKTDINILCLKNAYRFRNQQDSYDGFVVRNSYILYCQVLILTIWNFSPLRVRLCAPQVNNNGAIQNNSMMDHIYFCLTPSG